MNAPRPFTGGAFLFGKEGSNRGKLVVCVKGCIGREREGNVCFYNFLSVLNL